MLNLAALLSLVILLFHRGHSVLTCDSIITGWLADLSLNENPENATLTVFWNGLGQTLSAAGCRVDHLSLELWRVDQHSSRPDDFGTQEYFSAFERCNKLEPEHFLFHSHQLYKENETSVTFMHTVEAEYMFRVCPCHRRRHRSVSCDCQFSDHSSQDLVANASFVGRPQCSRILKMAPDSESGVMPWCLTGAAVLPHVGKRVEEVSLKSMLMNCTHLLVAGTMASCTPIQSYDHVLLTFHKLENASSGTCWEHRDFGTHNPVKVVSRLYSQSPFLTDNFSHGMGDFTAIVGLSADSSYCVQLEHVRHPYCMREITISHSSTYRMPRVCSVHMAKPITTATCSAPPPNVVTRFNFAQDPIFVATALALCVVVLIAGVCLGRKCLNEKASGRGPRKNNISSEHEPMISKILTTVQSAATGGGKTNVFLLHFEAEGPASAILRTWMASLADVVHDLEDEDNEEINQDPEGWVLDTLNIAEMRIVVLASNSMSAMLKENGSVSTLSSDFSEETSSLSSSHGPRNGLRAFALKHIQSHFAGNYRQLVVVSFDKHCPEGEAVARLLTPNKGPLVLPHHLSDLQHWITCGKDNLQQC